MILYSHILGTGSYLPENSVSNTDLAKRVDTSDEWIVQRTGIRSRHIAGDHEPTSFMATEAARKALEAAGMDGSDIDGVIVATATPDQTFPSVAVHVQDALGCGRGPTFDVHAACAGFVYALSVADSLLKTGHGKRFLVIGAEKFSSIINWDDRTTCVLFGDGAGAVVLEARAEEGGILATEICANGSLKDILYVDGGVATTQQSGYIVMQGKEVFRHAVSYMADIVDVISQKADLDPKTIDWLVPHQANIRIIESTAKKLGLPMEKVIVTVQEHGNTSAASIPLALDSGVRSGKIKRGELLFLEGLGAGLTWGAALIRY